MADKSLRSLGERPSVLPPRLIGLLRGTATAIAITGAAATAGLAYARWEARRPVLRTMQVPVPARPGFKGLTILHISDLHMFEGQDFIVKFLKNVADSHEIDFVVSTGDNLGARGATGLLFDAYEPLLQYPGAFVFGSNDYYSPLSTHPLDYLKPNRHLTATERGRRNVPDLPWVLLAEDLVEAGWSDLSNQSAAQIIDGQLIALVGVDDPHIERDQVPPLTPEWEDPQALRLGLAHAPYRRVLDAFALLGSDVIFAGHTHGGQVRIPFVGPIVTNCDVPRNASRGLSEWKSAFLHVSAGLGTSPFAPIRFACRPEATLMKLVPAE